MLTRTTTELEQLLDSLETNGVAPEANQMERLSQAIARLFQVESDEVAVLALSSSGKSLKFVIPEKLRAVGTIPLSSATALAARTARERRADVVNNFASSRHASVFEAVPLGRDSAGSIQKIMSAPILRAEKVIGVAQISRKGASIGECGPDFTARDLSALRGLNPLLERIVLLCHTT
jgi:hypothetical protein